MHRPEGAIGVFREIEERAPAHRTRYIKLFSDWRYDSRSASPSVEHGCSAPELEDSGQGAGLIDVSLCGDDLSEALKPLRPSVEKAAEQDQ